MDESFRAPTARELLDEYEDAFFWAEEGYASFHASPGGTWMVEIYKHATNVQIEEEGEGFLDAYRKARAAWERDGGDEIV